MADSEGVSKGGQGYVLVAAGWGKDEVSVVIIRNK